MSHALMRREEYRPILQVPVGVGMVGGVAVGTVFGVTGIIIGLVAGGVIGAVVENTIMKPVK